jgi:hypothetical protein
MAEIDYGTAMDVSTTWDKLKRITGSSFHDVVGEDILLK